MFEHAGCKRNANVPYSYLLALTVTEWQNYSAFIVCKWQKRPFYSIFLLFFIESIRNKCTLFVNLRKFSWI